jgi:hypothetical protein
MGLKSACVGPGFINIGNYYCNASYVYLEFGEGLEIVAISEEKIILIII